MRTLYSVAGIVLLCDQVTKFLAVWRLKPAKMIPVLPNVFHLSFVENTGIAFSLPLPNSIVIELTPLILLFFFIWFGRIEKTMHARIGAGLFIAGAVSNYIDRVLFGYTVDYIHVFTGVINLADIAVVVGILFLLKKPRPQTV
jgi:signal peptidase II